MTFGERLVYYREKAGLKQKQLAEALAITPTRLNYWEKDKREPDLKMLEAICEILNVECDVLLGRKNSDDSISSNQKTPTPEVEVDEQLQCIINCYHEIDDTGQEILAEQAEFLLSKHPKPKDVSNSA